MLRFAPMLAAGVRYRFANGLRAAMGVWGALIVAYAVAAGLKAPPPVVAWAHAWMAMPFPRRAFVDLGVGLALGMIARSAFATWVGGWGREQLAVLPLNSRQRFAIDGCSAALYLMPPVVAMVVCCSSVEPVVCLLVGSVIGSMPGVVRTARSGPSLTLGMTTRGPWEWRWWWRTTRWRVPSAVVTSTLVAAASVLAINNNRVVSSLAILRIEVLFLAIAAGVLASAILASRDAARPYRVTESVLPISASARLRTLLASAMPLFVVPLAAIALLRFSPWALVYGACVFAFLLVSGEVTAISAIAAVAGAIHMHAALLIVFLLFPLMWRRALEAV